MTETRDYLDRYSRITADNVEATITARNDDSTYMVETIDTRATLRASPANPVDTFAIGSRVIVSQPAATRSAIGALPVILSRAPRDQRGLSGTTPADSEVTFSQPSVISVDPDPLILVAGGLSGVQVIIGAGLTEQADYIGRVPAPDPTVTEADPPSIEPTMVIMSIAASGSSALGSFDLIIDGITVRDALKITPASGFAGVLDSFTLRFMSPTELLLIARDFTGGFLQNSVKAWLVDPATLAVLASSSWSDPLGAGVIQMTRAVERGGSLHLIAHLGGDTYTIVSIDPAADILVSDPFATFSGADVRGFDDADLDGFAATITGGVLYRIAEDGSAQDIAYTDEVGGNLFACCHIGGGLIAMGGDTVDGSYVADVGGGTSGPATDAAILDAGSYEGRFAERAWAELTGYGALTGRWINYTSSVIQLCSPDPSVVDSIASGAVHGCQWRDQFLFILADQSVIVTDFTTTTEISAEELGAVKIAAHEDSLTAYLLIQDSLVYLRTVPIE